MFCIMACGNDGRPGLNKGPKVLDPETDRSGIMTMFSVCLYVSVCLSVSLSPSSLSVSVCFCLSVCLFLPPPPFSLWLSVCLSVYLCLSLSCFSLCLCLSLSLSLSVCVCLCLSVITYYIDINSASFEVAASACVWLGGAQSLTEKLGKEPD